MTHALEPLTAEEIIAASSAVRAAGALPEGALIAHIVLDEPAKDALDSAGRRAVVSVVPPGALAVVDHTIDLAAGTVLGSIIHDGAHSALLFDESFKAVIALHESDAFKELMAKRGITDLQQVQIDPWPAGTFGFDYEEGRRISRSIIYFRESPADNGYARPVEGVMAVIDGPTGELLDLVDLGVVPIPADKGSYFPADRAPLREDLRPVSITQPEGVSFTLDGYHLRWQRWSLRIGFDPYEGLVLHQIGFDDPNRGGQTRPIVHRASVAEMVVPYGDPGPMHGWKNAFDVGEWGLGRMANSLSLGCDCLGEITYLDGVMSDEAGNPWVVPNAICLHEEDFGILWKHTDLHAGTTEVRRQRRMVISMIATVGNYEYGFYWYLYLDGTIELEVKLTGIMSTMAVDPAGPPPTHAGMVTADLAAPHHQHLFCARLDMDVDGTHNEVHEVDVLADPPGPDNPWANAFRPHATLLADEATARRNVDPSRSRTWKILNPDVRNAAGQPVAYKLLPGSTPTLLADPTSSVGRRAEFARHNLWVTPYDPAQRRPAGDFPNQSSGGDGLPAFTAGNRSLVGTDVVLWYSFGVTHVPRPEDWPVMPVERAGFSLVPFGFFDRNPTLDVPPPAGHGEGDHCHA